MPESLRTPEEKFLLEVFETSPGYWTQGQLFCDVVPRAFRDGYDVQTAAAAWQERAEPSIDDAARIALANAKPNAKKSKLRSRKR